MDISKATIILPLLFLFPCSVAIAQSQSDMNNQACDDARKADVELNRVYQQVLSEYKADALFVQKLRIAQRAWVAFRSAHTDSLYPAANPQSAYGSVYQMCLCTAQAEITKKRTEELKRWLDGMEEGDVCSGSVKIRTTPDH